MIDSLFQEIEAFLEDGGEPAWHNLDDVTYKEYIERVAAHLDAHIKELVAKWDVLFPPYEDSA